MSSGAIVFWVWLVLMVSYLVAWGLALRQIVRTPDDRYRRGNQILWAVVVVVLPFVGLLAYRVVGSPRD